MDVHLLETDLHTSLERVIANDSRKAFIGGKRVIGLPEIGDGGSHDKGAGASEDDVFNSLKRRQRNQAGRSRAVANVKTLGGHADSRAAFRLADDIGVAHITEMEFVYGGAAEGPGIAQTEELRPPVIQSAETGNGGAALSAGKRIGH